MINRKPACPILGAILLSFVVSPALIAQVGSDPANTPASPKGSATTVVAPATALPAPTYTVQHGDTLTSIADKYNTTRKKLEALNNLASTKVKPGQVLIVGAARKAKSVATHTKTPTHHSTYAQAQPVQDFDVPASTFASCPVPEPTDDASTSPDAASTATFETDKPARIAKLVSPAELAAEQPQAEESAVPVKVAPAPEEVTPAEEPAASPVPSLVEAPMPPPSLPKAANESSAPQMFSLHSSRPTTRTLMTSSGPSANVPAIASDWGSRFLVEARSLGNEGIEYDEDWRPPGESRSWTMDCSNTARYLYKVTAGIQLPRTASDQYYYLHLQDKAWDVPQAASGYADTGFLRHNLKPGDLLFWENTYRPERQPPITHVMVFLGTNARGQWIMAGSQSSRGGEHNRRNGGPDIYVFNPTQPCGGYTTWMGLVHHRGRFCAFGRPLEADAAKLAMASDD